METKQITYFKLYDNRGKWVAVEYNAADAAKRLEDHKGWKALEYTANVPIHFNDSRR